MKTNSLFIFILATFISIQIPCSLCQNSQYDICSQPFHCGTVRDISYPFWGGNRSISCGHPGFELMNCEDHFPPLNISSRTYRFLDIHIANQTITIARDDLLNENLCPNSFYNTTLNFTLFDFYSPSDDQNVTFHYGCDPNDPRWPRFSPYRFECNNRAGNFNFYLTRDMSSSLSPGDAIQCENTVTVPVNQAVVRNLEPPAPSSVRDVLQNAIEFGFSVEWTANNRLCEDCVGSGGFCGYNPEWDNEFVCYCAHGNYTRTCPDNSNSNGNENRSRSNRRLIIGLGVGSAVLAVVGLIFLIFCIRLKRRHRVASKSVQIVTKEILPSHTSKDLSTSSSTTLFTRSIPSYPSSNLHLSKCSSYFGTQVFDYTELEEATDHFNASRELGDGGFGTVYYGELQDGRAVAVKRLYDNNFRRLGQFMNEVEILTRLRHKNLVVLFGCTSKQSRELLLVYEYISNGTVADHLHGERAKSKGLLPWTVRLNIAIETAEALAYLHESDTIHRDVKTTNILLEDDFHVKVADFGLSRLFPNNVTHVSTAPQGTPGYVDPEYHQCYHLTEKSDVYSFGVVLVELISSLQAVDITRHRHDINLSNMAITKIQSQALHELVDPSLGFETDSDVRKMISSVAELAFRCLQPEKDMRPSMDEVLEDLRRIQEGDRSVHKVDIVDILVKDDDSQPLNGVIRPQFSDSDSSGTWLSGSATTSYRLSV